MKSLILLLLLSALGSCSLSQDNDKLLTSDIWILEWKIQKDMRDTTFRDFTEYFSQKDSAIILAFFNFNKALLIGGKKIDHSKADWAWANDEKDRILIAGGTMRNDYIVTILKKDELVLFFIDNWTHQSEMLFFRHPGYEDWISDEMVEMQRKINSNRNNK